MNRLVNRRIRLFLGLLTVVFGGLFLRAEWEYVRFTAATEVTINTVRGGLGYKF